MVRYARSVDPPLYCSFCGNSKDDVRKLIGGGGRQVSADRVLSQVFICDECVGLCYEIVAQGTTEPEARGELAEAAESLVVAVIDLLRIPPAGYGDEMLGDLQRLTSGPLVAVQQALAELRADRPYPANTREPPTEASLEAAHRRAWDLIDAYRAARGRNRAPE